MSAAMIEADGLVRRFASRPALDGLSLTLHSGDSLAVIGPNGAGKTTLLRVIAGLLRPDEGTISVGGHRYPDARQAARPLIGYLGHDPLLYLDLTASQNLELYADLYGVPSGRALAGLERVGLLARAYDPVRTFSRGMVQRLALARLLLHQPRLLLLDEPFAGLDAAGTELLEEVLHDLGGERGLVLVTHDMAIAARHATRVVGLRCGVVAFEMEGPVGHDELVARYVEVIS
jgi:heme exporter protein A